MDFTIHENLEVDKNAIPKEERKTIPKLTKFERARVIGIRAVQLSQNAPTNIEVGDIFDTMEIAKLELIKGMIPLVIRRYLPSKKYEDWTINELVNGVKLSG